LALDVVLTLMLVLLRCWERGYVSQPFISQLLITFAQFSGPFCTPTNPGSDKPWQLSLRFRQISCQSFHGN
jgi:hypothetical protein